MKRIKYFLTSFIALILLIGVIACKKDEKTIEIYLPDGTPALALANILDEGFTYNGRKAHFNFVLASEIALRVANGDADIAVMPTVLAAKAYNEGAKIKMISNNVFGNLFLGSINSSIDTLEGLKGKVVYVTTGTTISLFKYILTANNIECEMGSNPMADKVVLASKTDASEIIPLLKQASIKNTDAYGVLGEPALTKAMNTIGDNMKIAVDFQEEYKKISDGDSYPQAGLVCKADMDPKLIESLYDRLSKNKDYVIKNASSLGQLYERYNSSLKGFNFNNEIIERCNIDLKKAKDIKDSINKYVTDLMKINLNDEFYYEF